jgi:glycolate oxidase iron-sulfur subunit
MRNEFSAAQLADPQMAEAALAVRTCVHCGICTATCPTYVLLGDERDGPRGRIVQMQKMLEPGGTVSPETVLHVDRCLSCLNCRSACPSGVDYQRLVDEARVHIQDHYRRPLGERLLRWIIAKVMTRPKLVALGLAFAPLGAWLPGKLGVMARTGVRAKPGRQSLSPPLPSHARGRATGISPASALRARGGEWPEPAKRIAIMPGCVQAAMAPQIDRAVARVLARRGIALVPLAGAGCCGALPHHLGRAEEARAWARRAIEAHEAGSFDGVLITATGCSAHLKDYAHLFAGDPVWEPRAQAFAGAARDFLELVTPLEGRPQSLRVAYHPACSMTNGLKLSGMGEALLAASGFTLVPFGESHLCCGSAGSYSILQPELSGQLRDRKLAQLRAADPDLVVSGNIGCLQQLGTGVPVLHVAELLDWAEGGPTLLPGKVELPAKPR